MRNFVGILCLVALAACSPSGPTSRVPDAAAAPVAAQRNNVALAPTLLVANRQRRGTAGSIAAFPDGGELVVFRKDVDARRTRAYTWRPVDVSEEHALRAIGGELVLPTPDGQQLRLRYDRHVEHPDGNWTWVGRPVGAAPGTEAIITFGDKAVFGSIPYGSGPPLRLTTGAGRVWMLETNGSAVAVLPGANPRAPDALLPPKRQHAGADTSSRLRASSAPSVQEASASAPTLDLLIGYTAGFASRLGGQSQANTRLTFLVDVANQAYANSQVDVQVRLLKTMQVTYPDATANSSALYALTGCSESSCTQVDPALQPLHDAREQYGADAISLVRNFNDPENASCGVAWVLGGGQVTIQASDDYAAMSVVSDSNGLGGPGSFPDNGYVCRDETLAHELGHNLGSAHDRTTSSGDDGVLQQDEYGRYPYSFGYKTATYNFFTIMAYGDNGQAAYRVFSNPQITVCGGHACGVTDQADNARSLRQTFPIVASFRSNTTFGDVPSTHWAYSYIELLYQAGVTGGCSTSPPLYCPGSAVTRDSMAVFLLRAKHGGSYVPPAATGMFADVPSGYWARTWIEQLAREGIVGGCGTNPLRYCPTSAVLRDQMAVMLLRAIHGASYVPPAATGMYTDVPTSYWAASWIEQLSREGIAGGCSTTPKKYCPGSAVTRDQMAVFLVRAFDL